MTSPPNVIDGTGPVVKRRRALAAILAKRRILATLRDQANFMPTRQLDQVLKAEWGPDWRKQFRWFNPRPIAAASIGQVHKALTRDGEELAIKVQYPGVAKSIDSDVDNDERNYYADGVLPEAPTSMRTVAHSLQQTATQWE